MKSITTWWMEAAKRGVAYNNVYLSKSKAFFQKHHFLLPLNYCTVQVVVGSFEVWLVPREPQRNCRKKIWSKKGGVNVPLFFTCLLLLLLVAS